MSLTPISSVTQRTAGRVSSSSSRVKPRRPAPSDDANRPDPIPALKTATAVPSASVGNRADSKSGQSPLASVLEHAPSVIESPSATIAAARPGESTSTSYATNTWCDAKPKGNDTDDTWLPDK